MTQIKACCQWIDIYLQYKEYPIYYNQIFREYYLGFPNNNNIILLDYCPWCNAKLPKSLRDEFFNILEEEYNIETDIGECFGRIDLPEEFKTDKWWKERDISNDIPKTSAISHKRLLFKAP
jgi:hypothetical protein